MSTRPNNFDIKLPDYYVQDILELFEHKTGIQTFYVPIEKKQGEIIKGNIPILANSSIDVKDELVSQLHKIVVNKKMSILILKNIIISKEYADVDYLAGVRFIQVELFEPKIYQIEDVPLTPTLRHNLEGNTLNCPQCNSSMKRVGFWGIFGPKKCINPDCLTNK